MSEAVGTHNAFREGRVHVQAHRCATCIFRPGNLMHLEPGRVESMCAEADKAEAAIICHSTLTTDNAVCHGYFERRSSLALRLAELADVVEFVPPDR